MFLFILNFLRQHVVAVAEILLLAVLLFQHLEIIHLGSELQACRNDNMTLSADNADLSVLIEKQDAAIAGLKALADKKSKAATRALAHAKSDAAAYAAAAQAMQSQPVAGDECTQLRSLLHEYFRS